MKAGTRMEGDHVSAGRGGGIGMSEQDLCSHAPHQDAMPGLKPVENQGTEARRDPIHMGKGSRAHRRRDPNLLVRTSVLAFTSSSSCSPCMTPPPTLAGS